MKKYTFMRLLKLLLRYPYHKLRSYIRASREAKLIAKAPLLHTEALQRLKNKQSIRCGFFVIFHQVWKCDEIYKEMMTNSRFDPIIVVCPRVNFGKKAMVRTQNECYSFFCEKGYNVIKAYDEVKDVYLDIQDLGLDIIFYTNPYHGLIDERYFITNFLNTLTVYVPYMFGNNNDVKSFHDQLLHNLVWRFYAESSLHVEYSKKNSRNNGRNVVNTGYPGIENYVNPVYHPSDKDWKIKKREVKRIIWAPHHTIQTVGNVNYSCFLRYAEFMLEMADKYSEDVQFVFKPHPLLKDKLFLLWGEEKTMAYYKKWELKPNVAINEGFYEDLFLTSDAMIHDCGSFVVEYLYVNKPVMRTLNEIPVDSMFNSFAQKCLEQYYMAYSEQDIEQFIQNVINDIDPLKEQRSKFVNEVLIPKGSPSKNIMDDILESIDKQILYRS